MSTYWYRSYSDVYSTLEYICKLYWSPCENCAATVILCLVQGHLDMWSEVTTDPSVHRRLRYPLGHNRPRLIRLCLIKIYKASLSKELSGTRQVPFKAVSLRHWQQLLNMIRFHAVKNHFSLQRFFQTVLQGTNPKKKKSIQVLHVLSIGLIHCRYFLLSATINLFTSLYQLYVCYRSSHQ